MQQRQSDQVIARCSQQTHLGEMTITVWETPWGTVAQLQAPFILEWGSLADDGLEDKEGESSPDGAVPELWEELNPYSWEDPDEFPETDEQWQNYLVWTIEQIVVELEHRLDSHCRALEPIAQKYYRQCSSNPSVVWLLEHYPKDHRLNRENHQFRLRVISRVLESMKDQPVQLKFF